MKDKVVKTRKDHVCCNCDELIKKGDKAIFYAAREPVFDSNERQIGIKYESMYTHYDTGCAKRVFILFGELKLTSTPFCWPINPRFENEPYVFRLDNDENIIFIGETWEDLWLNIQNNQFIDIEYEESLRDV